MASTDNAAAFLIAAKAHPFEVKPAPVWTPEENEILVKNHVMAINPVDGNLQYTAFYPLSYPTILGQDVAGEVVAVGPNVTRFKPGDRVVGHAVAMATGRHEDAGFQLYTILQTKMSSPIPAGMAYERAAVLPLGLSTAASGLFRKGFLNLQRPTVPARKPTGNTVLVWGGASSVGSNAIQLCVAAGYEVITTASARNFHYAKKLGAAQVFDYNSPTVHADLLNAFKGNTIAGAMDCIGAPAWAICLDVAQVSTYPRAAHFPPFHPCAIRPRSLGYAVWRTCFTSGALDINGGEELLTPSDRQKTPGNKFVATTKRGFPEPPEGVQIQAVFGTTIKDDEVGTVIYEDFLPKALEAGSYVPSPEPLLAGEGLESLQAAVDLQRAGVSARKVVVRLQSQ
ncbi:hypothetical protein DL764_005630 [Monosporascus ibericus]|uniref:Enoyl reductase (ER) domain-containing protein n=1 Tax=Monosporascus ibericus TaxID=155417 RepID=A0A4Q4T8E3_9PEZI|nr:hypothetical protein DL764_005630 [Monosporascus ibericus]